jgi:hypothetical protein
VIQSSSWEQGCDGWCVRMSYIFRHLYILSTGGNGSNAFCTSEVPLHCKSHQRYIIRSACIGNFRQSRVSTVHIIHAHICTPHESLLTFFPFLCVEF